MFMPKSPSLKKLSNDSALLSHSKPRKRSKKRDGSKSRSVNKMPPINNPSAYYVPRDIDISQTTPYKTSPRRIKTLQMSHVPSTKHLSLNKLAEPESRSIETNSTRTSNFTKVKFPGIFGDSSSTSTSKDQDQVEDTDSPRDKMAMSPVKKTLQVLTSSPTKSNHQDTHGGFSQAVRESPAEKSLTRDLLSAKKYKSQPTNPLRKEKLKTQIPMVAKHAVLAHTENSQIEGIDNMPTGIGEDFLLPYIGATKHSLKGNGSVKAYAANTSQGLVRNYNEDRVSIILNISKPAESTYQGEWPVCSFFAVYDGHGGEACADFLRDHLHQMIVRNSNFPANPVAALRKGFAEAEAKFLEQAENSDYQVDRSGSCALVLLIVDDMCYIANVGDSRAVLSCERGKKVLDLSRDHKPSDEEEKARIIKNGGRVYQTQAAQQVKNGIGPFASTYNTVVMGPCRVFPGRLSVSRTFGDIEAKFPKYDGLPGVVIAEPEIKGFKITDESDFIVLACDGIYDKLSSEEVVECVWKSTGATLPGVHQQSAAGVEYIMRQALLKRTTDNITVLVVSLCGFLDAFNQKVAESNLIEANQQNLLTKQKSLSTEPGINSDYSSAEDRFDFNKRPMSLKEKGNELRRKKRIVTLDKSEDSAHRRALAFNSDTRTAKKNSISFTRGGGDQSNTSFHSPGAIKLGKSIVIPRKKVL